VVTVHWTSVAFRQFRGIVDYVAAFSPSAGSTLADRITQALDNLETFPRLGRMVPDYQDEAIRELIVGDYRVVYRLVGDEVRIIAVLHGSQDLMRHLPDGPWDIE
jgi:toxin ParE1/3/4